ncbi:hypothetical protein HPB49_005803 [Dermacentor silvarum]|uniref:Uncharacterized protein n=1 Tax=Dermacentor silvarum TaxID=543639 RepID=A0ACB8DVJ4_DERSI|nr:hypothetical protein HPB49_005803 [Dermacentor silvarum]
MAAPMRMDEGGAAPAEVTAEKSSERRVSWKLRRCGTSTGSKGVEWPFYWQLHAFLGTLPVNDSDLVEESVEVPEVYEAPDDAQVVASWDATNADQEESSTGGLEESSAPRNENCGAAENAASPAASCPPSSRKRKRPSTVLQDLMTLFSCAEERAAANAKDSLQLRKELVELKKEANDIDKNMAEMVKNHFPSRKNKG